MSSVRSRTPSHGQSSSRRMLRPRSPTSAIRRTTTSSRCAQKGGAAGTLAGLGESGRRVRSLVAAELELSESVVSWHTNRLPVARLAAALDAAARSCAKVGLDVVLLAQSEVGEVAEAGRGA